MADGWPSMRTMNNSPRSGRQADDWLRPRAETRNAVRYLDTIRERWWLIAGLTILAVLAALVYVETATKQYQAEATILITPVSNSEPSNTGLGLITESNDPTQTVSTAARLISTPAVAQSTKSRLRLTESAQSLLADVSVEPIAQSSLIAVQARRTSAAGAALVASTFARSAVALATEELHASIAAELPTLERQLASLPPAERTGPGTLGQRIAALQALGRRPIRPCVWPASPHRRPRPPRRKRSWRSWPG